MTEFLMAKPIPPDSWLHEPRWAMMKKVVLFAGTRSAAIPALSKITPEEAVLLYQVMRRAVSFELGQDRAAVQRAKAARDEA